MTSIMTRQLVPLRLMQVARTPVGVLATPGLVVPILEYGLPRLNLVRDLGRGHFGSELHPMAWQPYWTLVVVWILM
jgi:hypothetical protein